MVNMLQGLEDNSCPLTHQIAESVGSLTEHPVFSCCQHCGLLSSVSMKYVALWRCDKQSSAVCMPAKVVCSDLTTNSRK